MNLSLQDINVDLSGANTLEELKFKIQKILSDLLASLQSQPRILVFTDATSRIPNDIGEGTVIIQLTESTSTNPYGTVEVKMLGPNRTIIPQS